MPRTPHDSCAARWASSAAVPLMADGRPLGGGHLDPKPGASSGGCAQPMRRCSARRAAGRRRALSACRSRPRRQATGLYDEVRGPYTLFLELLTLYSRLTRLVGSLFCCCLCLAQHRTCDILVGPKILRAYRATVSRGYSGTHAIWIHTTTGRRGRGCRCSPAHVSRSSSRGGG